MIITVTAFNGCSRGAWEHNPGRGRGTARGRGPNHHFEVTNKLERRRLGMLYLEVALLFLV